MGLSKVRLFTVGHSNHSFADFAALLQQHQIACIADVRSAPYSKYCPHFCKPYFEKHLFPEYGIEYRFYGQLLGGRRPELHQLKTLAVPIPLDIDDALTDLLQMASKRRIVLMCGEENPYRCHRHMILVRRLLQEDFWNAHQIGSVHIWHIRGSGLLEDASDTQGEEQMTLPF